jgi:hypothetical protein
MNVTGEFRYLKPSVCPSLYRNGEVLTRRDPDGSDAGTSGVDTEEHPMPIHDARLLTGTSRCTLERNGFELLAHPLAAPTLDFLEHEAVARRYYPDCEALLKAATGATRVVAFDHNVRSAAGKSDKQRIAGGQQVQGPAQMVHGDYTLTSAPQRLRDLSAAPSGNDTLRSLLDDGATLLDAAEVKAALSGTRRYAIINVWRNIAETPVATHPLALCDAQSVNPEDLVVFEIHYQDRIGENYFAKHAARHEWFYYPAMTRDEALLIKQWDSAGPLARSLGEEGDSAEPSPCTFSFHSSFTDYVTPHDAPERWSIEVRCIVLY